MLKWAILLVALIIINGGNGAKILAVFNFPAYSHYMLGHHLMKGLVAKGHDVTMISAFGKDNSNPKYRNIYLENMLEDFEGLLNNHDTGSHMDVSTIPPPLMMFFMNKMCILQQELTLKHKNVQKLLASNEKFDLVIVEQFFNDALKGFCDHYKAPCIGFSTVGACQINNYIVANPSPPSYIPDIFTGYSSEMTFLQRMNTFIFKIYVHTLYHAYYIHQQNNLLHTYFPDAPSINELNSNISLMFVNSHISVSAPIPHVPNMIEIGGIHLEKAKKLPDDLQKFLDNAKEGVVYFSLGSHLKSKDLPLEKREAILKVFSNLKLKVLWKFEEDLPGKTANVMISKWLPQNDVLAHPNIKVFISHGGMLSTMEAVYHGVPIIGIPLLGDQWANLAEIERVHVGVRLPVNELNEETLSKSLNTILNDKTYKENAMKRSAIMKDRPLSAVDTGIYWVEYVLKHNGASHMKSVAVDMPWYIYYSVDVKLFLVAVGMVPVAFVALLLYCLCKKRTTTADKKQKKKKA